MPIAGSVEHVALQAFHRAAKHVPAYQRVLSEAGVVVGEIRTPEDFQRLPLLGKHNTFSRFPIEELCVDRDPGELGSVLTSSGSGGAFAFGLNESAKEAAAAEMLDSFLDAAFSVRSRRTLLINCLPMGVKVHSKVCTLAETSVRPDMAIALVKKFRNHFGQFIIVGDPGFVKILLELGEDEGVEWPGLSVHVILGEETLAENARTYFAEVLGIDLRNPEDGLITSSMGIGEFGLHLFFEMPSMAPIMGLRRLLHHDPELRSAVMGPVECVPSLFTYDPRRIFVEFDSTSRLVLTKLDLSARLPLTRYLTGDSGGWLTLHQDLQPRIEGAGLCWSDLCSVPIVMIQGRGRYAAAAEGRIYPEAVKEGIYHDKKLIRKTTANFRLVPGEEKGLIRIQLAQGVVPDPEVEDQFSDAISQYVMAPFTVACEPYSTFGSGMVLDYERKFDYLGN